MAKDTISGLDVMFDRLEQFSREFPKPFGELVSVFGMFLIGLLMISVLPAFPFVFTWVCIRLLFRKMRR